MKTSDVTPKICAINNDKCNNKHIIEKGLCKYHSNLRWKQTESGKLAVYKQKIETSKRRKRRMRQLVDIFGRACKRCGLKTHIDDVYEFHHRSDKIKLFTVGGSGVKKSWNDCLTEAEKCDMLCANCHRIEDNSYHPSTSFISQVKRTRKRRIIDFIFCGKCQDCGLQTSHTQVYEFHHVDHSLKTQDPSAINSWNDLLYEVMLCDLLCANCHRTRHFHTKKKISNLDPDGRKEKELKHLHSISAIAAPDITLESICKQTGLSYQIVRKLVHKHNLPFFNLKPRSII